MTLGCCSCILHSDPGQPQLRASACIPLSSASKRKVGQWTDAQMSGAMAAVERGAKIRAVARNFDIPANTLADHMNGRILQGKKGPPTVLT